MITSETWSGPSAILFGCIAMIISLVILESSMTELYTSYVNALSYTEMVALSDIIPVFGIIVYFCFLFIGLSAIGLGSYFNTCKGLHSDWLGCSGIAIMGTITIVISLVMFNTIQGQLHDIYVLFSYG